MPMMKAKEENKATREWRKIIRCGVRLHGKMYYCKELYGKSGYVFVEYRDHENSINIYEEDGTLVGVAVFTRLHPYARTLSNTQCFPCDNEVPQYTVLKL